LDAENNRTGLKNTVTLYVLRKIEEKPKIKQHSFDAKKNKPLIFSKE